MKVCNVVGYITLFIYSCSGPEISKDYFESTYIEWKPPISEIIVSLDSAVDIEANYFKILLKDSRSDFNILNYPLNFPNDVDKELLISSLLSFKGDSNLCILPIMTYDPKRSKIYDGLANRYSIQLEALFLINQIAFEQPFQYSPIPALVDIKSGQVESVKGDIVNRAFDSYFLWYETVQDVGIEEVRKRNLKPLDKSGVRWY